MLPPSGRSIPQTDRFPRLIDPQGRSIPQADRFPRMTICSSRLIDPPGWLIPQADWSPRMTIRSSRLIDSPGWLIPWSRTCPWSYRKGDPHPTFWQEQWLGWPWCTPCIPGTAPRSLAAGAPCCQRLPPPCASSLQGPPECHTCTRASQHKVGKAL